MFFGLTNSLAMFQTIMNEIFQDLINTGKVASFINNVIVETEDEEEYNDIVVEVVRKLVENDLYVKPKKYKQKVRKVGFLEVVIGLKGIKIEKDKIKDVLDWLTLKCVKDVQKFLELANYYQWFIKNFTSITRPLHDMVRKNQKQKWMEKQEKVFKELKEKFTKEPVLVVPDLD